jgi:hypothetical protein
MTWPIALVFLGAATSAAPVEAPKLREDARSVEQLINDNYAYPERLAGGRLTVPPKLRAEAEAVNSPRELVRYSERVLSLLADHHAITGSSLKDSWAVFPSYGDLWVDRSSQGYVIKQVRQGSPASKAGITEGDRLSAIDGVPMSIAVANYWADLGTTGGAERDAYAARVLAAGRRDRPRSITVTGRSGVRSLILPSLYSLHPPPLPPVSTTSVRGQYRIRFNDSLGESAAIAAFDTAMAAAPRGHRLLIDLQDTPSGGNTTVARAVLSWFVSRPTFYQMHNLPVEERATGIARQWVEQVLPRPGKHYRGPVTVRVARWTGSMGEGLAIGFHAIGARVEGTRMAGLRGAVYDYKLPASGLVLKLPTERVYTVDGMPRERFVPTAIPRATQ